jgi:hypothetical protein
MPTPTELDPPGGISSNLPQVLTTAATIVSTVLGISIVAALAVLVALIHMSLVALLGDDVGSVMSRPSRISRGLDGTVDRMIDGLRGSHRHGGGQGEEEKGEAHLV